MRTVLFFDDWPILARHGIDRRWFPAEPWPGLEPWHDPTLSYQAVNSVLRDPESGRYRMWGVGMTSREHGDEGAGLCAYDSADGFDWQPMRQDPLVDKNATRAASHIVFSGEYSGSGAVFRDDREPDPARRYKLVYSDLSPNPVDSSYGTCRVAVSPDGIHWSIDRGAVWRRQHTDTLFTVLDNPYTGSYQWNSRPILGDRRVSLDQTRDWKHFEEPLVIVHPDPMDMPGVELYGMPHFVYEGYFVGFLWRMWGAENDLTGSTRFRGPVDAELAYSVNGIAWNRTNRLSFLPPRDFSGRDIGSQYPSALVVDEQGWLRVYTASCVGEHLDGRKFGSDETIAYTSVYRWRRDGFCALQSHSDIGTILTRGFMPKGGRILLNATTGRFGRIRCELRGFDNAPLPGFGLDACVPVTGDGHELPLRWKEGGAVRDTLESVRNRPVRLYLELEQARLYALRLDADLAFGFVPETDLAGHYVPNRCI